MNLLNRYQDDIQQLCIKYNVNQLYAFGSVLTADFKDSSDIDLIVNFDNLNIDDYTKNDYSLKFSLEAIFNRRVDLLEENALKNPCLKRSIEKQRQLVYG